MQYLFDSEAGAETLGIKDESYRYLFKVRRHKIGEVVTLRNLKDDFIYFYEIKSVSKKEALLVLKDKKELIVKPERHLHIGWCVVDPKTAEKTLPMLNEIGVSKISFIYCQRSQKNFKINLSRIEKILINSSQQCGRSQMMKVEVLKSLEDYLKLYPKSALLDFDGKKMQKDMFRSILVGCEGGFDKDEKRLLSDNLCYNLSTPLILRSESAVVSVASMVLLD